MSSNSTFSVIGSDVVITGNVAAKVDLHIDGKVDGDVKCQSLVQGEASEIRGAVVAEKARLAGVVEGSIDARELTIEASARIKGDVVYESITIEQGGHVDGQFKHRNQAMNSQKSLPPAGASATLIGEKAVA